MCRQLRAPKFGKPSFGMLALNASAVLDFPAVLPVPTALQQAYPCR